MKQVIYERNGFLHIIKSRMLSIFGEGEPRVVWEVESCSPDGKFYVSDLVTLDRFLMIPAVCRIHERALVY